MVKLSKTSKLDGILSWSLQAGTTCPGSIDPKTKEVVKACKGCYAKINNYLRPNVIEAREFNQEDWKRETWVEEMVQALDNSRYFRWFDSGDVYHPELAAKILEVMQKTPWVQHWLPTRSYKIPKLRKFLEQMQELPNVMVRYSSDEVDGTFEKGLHGSCIIAEGQEVPAGTHACLAYQHEGKCSGCRACYSKEIPVVAYQAHGFAMKKVIKLQLAA